MGARNMERKKNKGRKGALWLNQPGPVILLLKTNENYFLFYFKVTFIDRVMTLKGKLSYVKLLFDKNVAI